MFKFFSLKAILIATGFCIAIACVFYVSQHNNEILNYGIVPRTYLGLTGIFLAPFIHHDIAHLMGNITGIWVLTFFLFQFYDKIALQAFLWNWLLTGFWVWVAAREANHIGASGLVYALASFIIFSGVFRKTKSLKWLSLLVVLFYGGLVWGVFPIIQRISWESHLFGLISGLITAWFFRKEGPISDLPYQWTDDLPDSTPEDRFWEIETDEISDSNDPKPDETPMAPYRFTYHYTPKKVNESTNIE